MIYTDPNNRYRSTLASCAPRVQFVYLNPPRDAQSLDRCSSRGQPSARRVVALVIVEHTARKHGGIDPPHFSGNMAIDRLTRHKATQPWCSRSSRGYK